MSRGFLIKVLLGLIVVFSVFIGYSVVRFGLVESYLGRRRNLVKSMDQVRQKFENVEWDYRRDSISATIVEVITQDQRLVVEFQWPPNMPLHGEQWVVKVECAKEETGLTHLGLTGDIDLTNETKGVDIFEIAEKNDSLSAYCLNEECDTVGKSCSIRKFIRES